MLIFIIFIWKDPRQKDMICYSVHTLDTIKCTKPRHNHLLHLNRYFSLWFEYIIYILWPDQMYIIAFLHCPLLMLCTHLKVNIEFC